MIFRKGTMEARIHGLHPYSLYKKKILALIGEQ